MPKKVKIGGEALHKRQRLRKRDILVMVCAAVAILVGIFLVFQWLEDSNANPEPQGDYHARFESEMLTINGKQYRQKKNLTTILVMGIDRDSDEEMINNNRNGGNADFMRLLVIDPAEKILSQVAIDRDTMTPITILGMLGNRSGTRVNHISLSHGYGDGKEQSNLLAMEAVSNLFFNVPINQYISLNMDGISVLNDSVGGITVTLEDDFSHLDPDMSQGATVTLMGDQAELFVRSRMSVGVGTNESRMARQEQYLSKLTDALLHHIGEDSKFIGDLYDQLKPYLQTSMSKARLVNEAWTARNYTRTPVIHPAGTHEIGSDGFMEFHADEKDLEQIVLDLFYQEVK